VPKLQGDDVDRVCSKDVNCCQVLLLYRVLSFAFGKAVLTEIKFVNSSTAG